MRIRRDLRITDRYPRTPYTVEQLCRTKFIPEDQPWSKNQVFTTQGAHQHKHMITSMELVATDVCGTKPDGSPDSIDRWEIKVRYLGCFYSDNRFRISKIPRRERTFHFNFPSGTPPHGNLGKYRGNRPVTPVGHLKLPTIPLPHNHDPLNGWINHYRENNQTYAYMAHGPFHPKKIKVPYEATLIMGPGPHNKGLLLGYTCYSEYNQKGWTHTLPVPLPWAYWSRAPKPKPLPVVAKPTISGSPTVAESKLTPEATLASFKLKPPAHVASFTLKESDFQSDADLPDECADCGAMPAEQCMCHLDLNHDDGSDAHEPASVTADLPEDLPSIAQMFGVDDTVLCYTTQTDVDRNDLIQSLASHLKLTTEQAVVALRSLEEIIKLGGES